MLFAVFGLSTTAQAQTYPEVATLTIDRTQVSTCQSATITGVGYLPNSLATLTISCRVIGTVQTDASGTFSFVWAVPSDQAIGPVAIVGTDGTNTLTVNTTVIAGCAGTVNPPTNNGSGSTGVGASSGSGSTGSGSSATGGSLATTGSEYTVLFVRLAVLLLAAGGILLLVVNRRQRRGELA